MQLILIRHGESEDNRQSIIQGQLDSALSPLGLVQAQQMAQAMDRYRISALYASDLQRARQSAQAIAQRQSTITVQITPTLRERHYGILQGRTKAEIGLMAKQSLSAAYPTVEGGESIEQFEARVGAFIGRLEQQYGGDDQAVVVLVSHLGVIRAALKRVVQMGGLSVELPARFDNCSISVVRYGDAGRYILERINDASSLSTA